jgi:hypothetical protein
MRPHNIYESIYVQLVMPNKQNQVPNHSRGLDYWFRIDHGVKKIWFALLEERSFVPGIELVDAFEYK